jgi:hypothetical protein
MRKTLPSFLCNSKYPEIEISQIGPFGLPMQASPALLYDFLPQNAHLHQINQINA